MSKTADKILLSHGSGGRMMHRLIEDLFVRHFSNQHLDEMNDAAILPAAEGDIAFTTDSFVIDPLFFPGGDIGKLSVCGTVNDLAVSGAEPRHLSVSFIIEEGFPMNELEKIVISLSREARNAGVSVVTGDTKVINKGKCDKLFINTAGIGFIRKRQAGSGSAAPIGPGDSILINGTIGDHGMAVMGARESFNFKTPVISDCASLNHMIRQVLEQSTGVKFMRDPTRGGVAAALNELAAKTRMGIVIDESAVPVGQGVAAICEILGFDPLHIANEGKVIMVAGQAEGEHILDIMRKNDHGKGCAMIGRVTGDHPGKVLVKTEAGGSRVLDYLSGDPLPRIC